MDSVTQMAFGAAVGGAVAGRKAGWRAFAWGAVVGTLPDLDSFVDYGSAVANFTYHRGYTHSLFVQTLAAPLIAWPIERLSRRQGLGYRHWLALVWLVLITHALLDSFTIYGTQLFLPFSDYPVGLGSIFIIDPLYTLPLIVGAIAAVRLQPDWRRARRWNAAGLVLSTAYLLWTVTAQQLVEARAHEEIAREGLPQQHVLATPTAINSVLWRIIVVGDEAHWEALHPIGGERPIHFRRYPNRPELLADIDDQWSVRRLQAFTKGFYAVNERDGDAVITDLRMGQAGYYVFAYRVGHLDGGTTVPIDNRRYRYPRPDIITALFDLYYCARGHATELIHCSNGAS